MKQKQSLQAIEEKRPRILVVEEDAGVAVALAARLERFGYHVCDAVCTGEEAIAAALEHQPDLILMDIELQKEMSGIETAGHITGQRDVPVIFLAYLPGQAAIEPAVKMNPYGYLIKPYDYVELRLSIEIALFKHKAAREQERLSAQLDKALQEVSKLTGLLPVCATCRKLRDDQVYWQKIESHLVAQPQPEFADGICPECSRRLRPAPHAPASRLIAP